MKLLERILLLVLLAGLCMAPQTAQVNSYVNGNVLTADQLNSEFGNLYSTINGLDEDNFLPTTSIPPANINSSIEGPGIARSVAGVLSVNPDDSTVEVVSDQVRIKDLGVTTAKLAALAVTTAKITDAAVTSAKLDSPVRSTSLGTAASPAFSFTGDPDTGMYSSAANTLNVTTSGTSRFSVSATEVNVSPVMHANGGLSSGDGSASAMKWKLWSGNLAPSASLTLNSPGGLVLACVGRSQFDSISSYVFMERGTGADTTQNNVKVSGGTLTSCIIHNFDNNSSNDYYLVMFYI